MRLSPLIGGRIFVGHNRAFHGDLQPILAECSKHFSLQDALAVGIDHMQHNYKLMSDRIERWRATETGIKLWVVPVLAFCATFSSRVVAQGGPKADHIKHTTCEVKHDANFTHFELHYHVTYTDDKPPYNVDVEANSTDTDSLYDQCGTFLKAVQVAYIDDIVADAKAKMARLKDEHLFLRVRKAAEK